MVIPLEDIDPEYCNDLIYTNKHGRKCMYREYKKAIYGTLDYSFGQFFQKAYNKWNIR